MEEFVDCVGENVSAGQVGSVWQQICSTVGDVMLEQFLQALAYPRQSYEDISCPFHPKYDFKFQNSVVHLRIQPSVQSISQPSTLPLTFRCRQALRINELADK